MVGVIFWTFFEIGFLFFWAGVDWVTGVDLRFFFTFLDGDEYFKSFVECGNRARSTEHGSKKEETGVIYHTYTIPYHTLVYNMH
jgi:hypothetical protein